jgi:hypothetical protein
MKTSFLIAVGTKSQVESKEFYDTIIKFFKLKANQNVEINGVDLEFDWESIGFYSSNGDDEE